ncbi:bifunctional riboflavin kinase/FAD synthetase [Alsobacter sp. SYSU M60028]|uniref:Riboflavin biosynthesis protein n=1 Tax=Alsobacter ponti TaxID=2962936 RepID=A0ABT1LCG7_9HYPH|nr:bifunctional riboflavin kinase/FAD synthetase [Alsobacter ponti]MCP8939187.1 bifunctional riboflavin kinase/FAD synthetase [Alsobacter ponti]
MTTRPVGRIFTVSHLDASSGALPGALAGSVAAIGNFDGLHLGHRAVFHAARTMAQGLGAPCVLLTFEPHPRAFFRPDVKMFRLTPQAVKAALAERMGLDGVVVMSFDAALSGTSAADFISGLLVGRLGLRGVAVGHDFHFGKGREGSPALLAAEGPSLGLSVEVIPPLQRGGAPVSSSAIRAHLEAGQVEPAAALLGYRWIVRSVVGHGDKRGRTLGFPTANMKTPEGCGLRHGIYAVRMAVDGVVRNGVASYGRRPTFDDGPPMLEVFLFDFSGDLYGKSVDVEFCAWLRGEEKFDSLDALIAQMNRDAEAARAALARGPDTPAPSLLPLRL